MGEVIDFRPEERARRAPCEDGARILFFTGVRYQRDDALGPAPPAKPRSPEEHPGGGKFGGGRGGRKG